MLLCHLELCIKFHVDEHVDPLVPDKRPVLAQPQEKFSCFEGEHEWFISLIDHFEEELHEELHLGEGS